MNYLVSEVNYGGRVSDPIDRRLLTTIVSDFLTPKLFEKDYSPISLQYKIPNGDWPHGTYITAVNGMPEIENPEIFGLNPNSNVNRNTQRANTII